MKGIIVLFGRGNMGKTGAILELTKLLGVDRPGTTEVIEFNGNVVFTAKNGDGLSDIEYYCDEFESLSAEPDFIVCTTRSEGLPITAINYFIEKHRNKDTTIVWIPMHRFYKEEITSQELNEKNKQIANYILDILYKIK